MRIKISILFFTFLILISISSGLLYASGRGFYMPLVTGSIDYDLYDSHVNYLGIGYAYDSNIKSNRSFNYRLNVGFTYFQHNFHYDESVDYNQATQTAEYRPRSGMHQRARLVSDHSFGLSVVKNSVYKYWLGPALRLGFIGIDDLGMSLGAGFTLIGLNFNIGSKFVIGFEAGYMFDKDIFFNNMRTITYYDGVNHYDEHFNSAQNHLFILKFSLFSTKPK